MSKTKTEKRNRLGQFFTEKETVNKLLELLASYKPLPKGENILEPSFGTGNFIDAMRSIGLSKIDGCEIDPELTNDPFDFFNLKISKKYNLIIGNPPFSKYNIKESFYHTDKYNNPNPLKYLPKDISEKNRIKIENAFIYKSINHLENKESSIAFILPVSFFIKNKNKEIKEYLIDHFSTIIIYQNDKKWFDRNIPCCFTVFTNIEKYKNKIIVEYENSKRHKVEFNIKNINKELIPKVIFHKKNGHLKNNGNTPLKKIFSSERIKVQKSYKKNNVSAKNILEKNKIPKNKNPNDYKIAIARVGNSSVGKCGLINSKKDILNDMFYTFEVKDKYQNNKKIKESICKQINNNRNYFKKITSRVGSKSIKKENIYNFKVNL